MEDKFIIAVMFFMSAFLMGCGLYYWHWRPKALLQQGVDSDSKEDNIVECKKLGLRMLLLAFLCAIITIAAGDLGLMAFLFWIISSMYMGIAFVEYLQMKSPSQALLMLIVPIVLSVQEYQPHSEFILIAIVIILYDMYHNKQLNPFIR